MLVPRFYRNSLNWIFHIGEFFIDVPKMDIDDNIFGYLNILLLACCLLFADCSSNFSSLLVCDRVMPCHSVISNCAHLWVIYNHTNLIKNNWGWVESSCHYHQIVVIEN